MSQSDHVMRRAIKRELQGEDRPLFDARGAPAVNLPKEQADRLRGQLQKVTEHLSAAHRIVPRLEDMQGKQLLTSTLTTAGRHYAVLAFVADGPSVGVANYGEHVYSSPYNRALTTDERLRARELFARARFAAFGVLNRNREWELDEALRYAVEPVILGDAASWAPGEIGRYLSGYTERRMVNAAGVTEVRAVLRRLRAFFQIGGED